MRDILKKKILKKSYYLKVFNFILIFKFINKVN